MGPTNYCYPIGLYPASGIQQGRLNNYQWRERFYNYPLSLSFQDLLAKDADLDDDDDDDGVYNDEKTSLTN